MTEDGIKAAFYWHKRQVLKSVRQPCRHIPWILILGFRPVALRPTLSDGLPLFNLFSVSDTFGENFKKNSSFALKHC